MLMQPAKFFSHPSVRKYLIRDASLLSKNMSVLAPVGHLCKYGNTVSTFLSPALANLSRQRCIQRHLHQHLISRQCCMVRQGNSSSSSSSIVSTGLQHSGSGGRFVVLSSNTSLCGASLQRAMSTRSDVPGLRLSAEVEDALNSRTAVVALESTIITHGMPHPHNAETALAVERVIRDNGAVPATVGMLNGELCVGLSRNEIQWLAENSSDLVKISRRDLPVVMSQGLSGGTTVSGTMIAAHMAGIPIFATGGIGGVHRCVADTHDVSADLRELGRTPVAVVAAGVKSILDIPRTLEYLETEGVCVVTYGATKDFPAFFTPRSGHSAPYHVHTPEAAANIVDTTLRSQLDSGILFAVPIPEKFAASGETIEAAIQEAVEAARRAGVKGKEVTPFILQRVNEITQGASLEANIALVKNNAKVAAQIALALERKQNLREEEKSPSTATRIVSPTYRFVERCAEKTVVVGGAIVDFCAKVKDNTVKMSGATYEGKIYQSFGGVGRNIADCLSRLGDPPLFISALGDDALAKTFLTGCAHMDLRGVQHVKGASTPTYCPVLTDSGHLLFGIGDMDLHTVFSPDTVSEFQKEIALSSLVCVDGNFSAAVIERVCQLCADAQVPVWFEPTDVHKATKPWQTKAWKHLTYISPNLQECGCIWSALTGQPHNTVSDNSSPEEIVALAAGYCRDLLRHIPVVMVTLGRHGLVLGRRREQMDKDSPLLLHHYPSLPPDCPPPSITSVSGAGDCLNAAMMHFILQGYDIDLCVKAGLMAAQHSLLSYRAVPSSIVHSEFTAEKVDAWGCFKPTSV